MESAPIKFERDGANWSVTSGSLVDIAARPAMGINPDATEPLHLDNTGHPAADRVALARAFRMNVNALGLSWNETKGNKSGQYAPVQLAKCLTLIEGEGEVNFDTIVRGGNVVTPQGASKTDVGIVGEKIAAIAPDLAASPGTKVIDASGHHVIPGVLDVHVHLELPFCGTVSSDDYRTGTRAGARGGVTTLIDFAIPYAGDSLDDGRRQLDEEGRGQGADRLHVPHLHHAVERAQGSDQGMVDRGFTTFKEFMIYESEGWQSDDRALFGTLEKMKEYGTMLLVHAESARVLDELIARNHTPELMKKYGAQLHAMTRPNFIEAEAIQRVVMWSEVTGGQLYIVHMSTAEGTEIVKAAQARGVPVIAETCAQYLVLNDDVFANEDGHLFACCPQLKKPADSARLWEGLKDGEVSVISTDTCTFTRDQKAMWEGDWTKIPMGMPGLETLLAGDVHARRARQESAVARGDGGEALHQSGEDHGTVSEEGRDRDWE